MYTAIRAFVLCDEVKFVRGPKMNLIGVASDPLAVITYPGWTIARPLLILELDGRPSDGIVRFTCEGLDVAMPIRTPGRPLDGHRAEACDPGAQGGRLGRDGDQHRRTGRADAGSPLGSRLQR
jgi:hypothetical protein